MSAIGMKLAQAALEWGTKLLRAALSGDERKVGQILKNPPRLDEEWARYQIAKEEKFK